MSGKEIERNEYRAEMQKAMTMLAEDSRTIFLGQTVAFPGSRFTFATLNGVPLEKRIELPIMEDAQMGMSIGLALAGYIPISIYPRMDFLVLAANQLVNHLDKFEELSKRTIHPKVIIRSVIGATSPIYPGPQHCQDHTEAFRKMLQNVEVVKLENPREIVPAYLHALHGTNKSSLLIDVGNAHYG